MAESFCPQCRAALLPDAKFCSKCGAVIGADAAAQAAVSVGLCSVCGAPILEGAVCCSKCGADVIQPTAYYQQSAYAQPKESSKKTNKKASKKQGAVF